MLTQHDSCWHILTLVAHYMVDVVHSFERLANENITRLLPTPRLLDSTDGNALRSSNRSGHTTYS